MLLPFSIEVQPADDRIRIVVRGELDVQTSPRLLEELHAAEAAAPATLVLDLRDVSFLDSTGLQLVLDAEVRAREQGRTFVVLPGDGEPLRILELADVADRLTLEEPGAA